MTFPEIVACLDLGFRGPLPGAAAHDLVAPRPRRAWPAGFDPARARDAAGLLLLFPSNDRAHVLLTVRAGTLERHGGQVSLPGGVVDPGETFEQAALREAHEEVALQPDQVRIVGALTPIDIPVSGFRLHPIVGAAAVRPLLRPSGGEVARIIEAPIDELLDPGRFGTAERVRDGRSMAVPAFRLGGDEIWGATAMVLAEFLVLVGWNASGRPRVMP